jgi:hypothetical protein
MQDDRVITGTIIIIAGILLAIFLVSYPGISAANAGENAISATVPSTPPQESGAPVVRHEGSPPRIYYWTEVDPVPDIRYRSAGNLTIRGTTNVPAGETLRVEFIAHSMHPSPMEYYPDLQFQATAEVKKGEGGINGWSVEIPSQDFMKPDIFQILVVNQSGYSIGGRFVNVTQAQ